MADERRQISIEAGKSFRAGYFALQGIEKIDHLPEGGAEMLGRTGFDFAAPPRRNPAAGDPSGPSRRNKAPAAAGHGYGYRRFGARPGYWRYRLY